MPPQGGGRQSDLFLDASGAAAALAQVVQLGSAHGAAALDLDALDQRAVGLEHALNALAVRDLAHREGGINAAVALGNANAFERLQTLAVAFTHPHLHHQRVAGAEVRHFDRGSLNGLFVDLLDDIHDLIPYPCSARYSSMNSFNKRRLGSSSSSRASKSGRFSQVRPKACLRRQRSIAA